MKGCAFSVVFERRFPVAHSGRTKAESILGINQNAAGCEGSAGDR
jgi:hypothetical protein